MVYVVAWVPGKPYYASGMGPAVLAAGSVSAERWITRGRRPRARRGVVVAASLVGVAVILPGVLPIVPAGDVHLLPASYQHSSGIGDTVGWPQLTRAIAAQDAMLVRDGQGPTSIFTGYYGESAALDVLSSADHLPPVLSGHNGYWMWGPGHASDRTVLVVDALSQLPPADHLPRPLPRAERLDRPADRRLHRPGGRLARAMAALEALWLTAGRENRSPETRM